MRALQPYQRLCVLQVALRLQVGHPWPRKKMSCKQEAYGINLLSRVAHFFVFVAINKALRKRMIPTWCLPRSWKVALIIDSFLKEMQVAFIVSTFRKSKNKPVHSRDSDIILPPQKRFYLDACCLGIFVVSCNYFLVMYCSVLINCIFTDL